MTPFVFGEPLPTERLRLRPLRPSDVDAVLDYQRREEVARFQGYAPRDRTAVVRWVEGNGAARVLEHDGDHLQPAIERVADGALIGDLYLRLRSVEHATVELGWTLHPDAQGAGYATEAVRGLLAVVFGRMGAHRAVAEVDPRNTASIALCRRLGMRQEGHLVEDVREGDGWADTLVFALLDREWAP